MKEVKKTLDTYTKCLCPVCPVTMDSGCLEARKDRWKAARLKAGQMLELYPEHPEAYGMEMFALEASETGRGIDFREPGREEMNELYCCNCVGKSDCGDLAGAPCLCPNCAVWSSHELEAKWFCKYGGQDENEVK